MSPNDELWGTFAVDDHLRPRAFVAETVLFDRLIVPQPPPDNDVQHMEWVSLTKIPCGTLVGFVGCHTERPAPASNTNGPELVMPRLGRGVAGAGVPTARRIRRQR